MKRSNRILAGTLCLLISGSQIQAFNMKIASLIGGTCLGSICGLITETSKLKSEANKLESKYKKIIAEAEKLKSECQKIIAEAEKLKSKSKKITSEAEKQKSKSKKITSEAEKQKIIAKANKLESKYKKITTETEKFNSKYNRNIITSMIVDGTIGCVTGIIYNYIYRQKA